MGDPSVLSSSWAARRRNRPWLWLTGVILCGVAVLLIYWDASTSGLRILAPVIPNVSQKPSENGSPQVVDLIRSLRDSEFETAEVILDEQRPLEQAGADQDARKLNDLIADSHCKMLIASRRTQTIALLNVPDSTGSRFFAVDDLIPTGRERKRVHRFFPVGQGPRRRATVVHSSPASNALFPTSEVLYILSLSRDGRRGTVPNTPERRGPGRP